jgi:hypothetical protein
MQMDKRRPGIKEPANDDNDRKYFQAQPQSDRQPWYVGER